MKRNHILSIFSLLLALASSPVPFLVSQEVKTANIISELYTQNFGSAVSIFGEYFLIGAAGDDSGRGSAYLYKISDSNYERKIIAFDGTSYDNFGSAVSIAGEYILIGAPGDNGSRGAAYLYKISDSSFERKIRASETSFNDKFGSALAIDSDYMLIGAQGDDGTRGAAYVYKISDTNYERKIFRTDAASIYSYFGSSVAIDGDYILIGAYGDILFGANAEAYVFKISDSSIERKIRLTDGESGYVVSAVAIDGDYILICAQNYNGSRGITYLYYV